VIQDDKQAVIFVHCLFCLSGNFLYHLCPNSFAVIKPVKNLPEVLQSFPADCHGRQELNISENPEIVKSSL